jgi:2-phospho-L-lactate transferase/gluconeogenesis factor (CofD/UPF0052 family)
MQIDEAATVVGAGTGTSTILRGLRRHFVDGKLTSVAAGRAS